MLAYKINCEIIWFSKITLSYNTLLKFFFMASKIFYQLSDVKEFSEPGVGIIPRREICGEFQAKENLFFQRIINE